MIVEATLNKDNLTGQKIKVHNKAKWELATQKAKKNKQARKQGESIRREAQIEIFPNTKPTF